MIIQREQIYREGEKSFIIYTRSSELNSFNGKMELRLSETHDWHVDKDSKKEYKWELQASSERLSPTELVIFMEGLVLASKLMNGDESNVNSDEEVQAFFDAVNAKRLAEQAAKNLEAMERAKRMKAQKEKDLADFLVESKGLRFLAKKHWHSDHWVVIDSEKFQEGKTIWNATVTKDTKKYTRYPESLTFKTEAKAQIYSTGLNHPPKVTA